MTANDGRMTANDGKHDGKDGNKLIVKDRHCRHAVILGENQGAGTLYCGRIRSNLIVHDGMTLVTVKNKEFIPRHYRYVPSCQITGDNMDQITYEGQEYQYDADTLQLFRPDGTEVLPALEAIHMRDVCALLFCLVTAGEAIIIAVFWRRIVYFLQQKTYIILCMARNYRNRGTP
jgi:hypothetical protein